MYTVAFTYYANVANSKVIPNQCYVSWISYILAEWHSRLGKSNLKVYYEMIYITKITMV